MDCPYVGLVPYSKNESEFFFGREAEREIIALNLLGSRVTLIYGASGVGKSSVLGAGVESDLRKRAIKDFKHGFRPQFIPILFNSWYTDPVASLNIQIESALHELKASVKKIVDEKTDKELDKEAVRKALRCFGAKPKHHFKTLVELLDWWTDRLKCGLLLILDQFEEYFLYRPEAQATDPFIEDLAVAFNQPRLGCNFLISIREDELAKLDIFGSRIPNLFQNKYPIKHLTRDKAEDAIRKPINEFNRLHQSKGVRVGLDDDVVEAVLTEIQTGARDIEAGNGGPPRQKSKADLPDVGFEAPFLQLVMTRLWEEARKEERNRQFALEFATLEGLGGVRKLIETHVDQIMATLTEQEQALAARVFSYLTTPSNRRMTHNLADLEKQTECSREQLEQLLTKLSKARILQPITLQSNATEKAKFYQVSHDILARSVREWLTKYEQAEQERRMQEEQAERERKMREESKAKFRAFSRELAAAAISNLTVDPERSLMLALYATLVGEEVGEPATQESEEALLNALQASHVRRTLVGHGARLWAVTYDRTGKRLATSSEDGTAAVWDAQTGERLMVFSGHEGWVMGVAFHPDGTQIITAGEDGTVQTWEVATGRSLRVWPLSSKPLNTVAYDKQGGRFAAGGDEGKIWLYDLLTDQQTLVQDKPDGAVDSVAFSPDGSVLALAGEDMHARLWDINSGEQFSRFNRHKDRIKVVAFSHNGTMLATAGHDGNVKIWALSSGKLKRNIPVEYYWLTSIAFSPDDRRLITVGKDKDAATVWDVNSGQPLLKLLGHKADVRGVSFSPDGIHVATASCDRTAKVWQVAGNEALIVRTHEGEVKSVAFSPDGSMLATGSNDKSVKLWTAAGELRYRFEGHQSDISSVAFSPDGRRLATASWNRTLIILDVSSGQPLFKRKSKEHLLAVAFSPEGSHLATSGTDRVARIWRLSMRGDEMRLREVMALEGHNKWVNALAYSPDGTLLATSSDDKTIRIWNLQTGEEAYSHASNDFFQGVAFGQDNGRSVLLASCHDGTALVWDFQAKTPPSKLLGHTKTLHHVATSPDGRLAATASEDCTVRVWDVGSKRELNVLTGHADIVWHVAFSQDGKRLATASLDKTARIWDVQSGSEILTLNRAKKYSKEYHPEPEARLYGMELNKMQEIAHPRVTRKFTEQECRKYLHLSDYRLAPDLRRTGPGDEAEAETRSQKSS